MATGIRADIIGARALAQKIATRIELDFLQRDEGRYDKTLLAYKPRVLGKTATEISVPELFDRYTKQNAKTKNLSASSINSRYVVLRKMLEKVLNVPANTTTLGGALARSSSYYSPYADFVAFLFGVGCRIGEAVGLRWENVADNFTSVYICESISRGVLGGTKTKQSRTVQLSPSISAMLKQRKDNCQANPVDLVFTTPTGLSINDRNFRRRAWTQVLKEAGVKYRSPYKSRSTVASHSITSGVDYVSVAKALGNSPKVLHDHYLDIIESRSIFVDFY